MIVKISKIFSKPWFSIVELIIVAIYLVDICFKVTDAKFSNNYWHLNLGISVIVIFATYIALTEFVKKSDSKWLRFVAITYAGIIGADTFLNDSAIGFVFISILLMNLIRNVNGVYKSGAQLFVAAIVGVEIASILYSLDVVGVQSVLFDNMGVVWVDVVLIISLGLYMFMQDKKLVKLQLLLNLLPMVVIVLDVIFVEALSVGLYFRKNSYCVSADKVEAGTSVYIMSAVDDSKALTYNGNTVTISDFDNGDNQIFTFERAEEDGYWHVVTNDSLVLDIANAVYEENNIVIAYDEIGLSAQHWQIVDAGNNLVKFVAYEPEYALTWGNHIESDGSEMTRTLISSNSDDVNEVFFLKNAETIDISFIDWIIDGNRVAAILVYTIIMICTIIATCVLFLKEKRTSLLQN